LVDIKPSWIFLAGISSGLNPALYSLQPHPSRDQT
jgi:hypothetical protein